MKDSKMDILKEVKAKQQEKEETKAFFDKLDKQNLLFETYVYAVMGRFKCDSSEAAKLIGEYLKGE